MATLSGNELVGYLRAEFAKASRLRVTLFFVQLLVALPAAASVFAPDSEPHLLYGLAVAGAVLLLMWWLISARYEKARAAAQGARRASLIMGGLGYSLSAAELQSLRNRFTVSGVQARACEKLDYYASQKAPGSGRLCEMIEESALYSEELQRGSSYCMLGVLILFAVLFIVLALTLPVYGQQEVAISVFRLLLALLAFVMSADVLGAYKSHRAAAEDIGNIRRRLMSAEQKNFPMGDVLLALADYNAAVEGAPESVPFLYRSLQPQLDIKWREYLDDREASRRESVTVAIGQEGTSL